MASSLMKGLELLEAIDVNGPVTVTELARLTGHDKSTVSRMLTAIEPHGWIVRDHGRITLGPRAALLAYGTAAGEQIRRAQPLVEAVSGVTGLTAQAYVLVGEHPTVIAAAGTASPLASVGVGMSTSLEATAAGQVILAQLSDAGVEPLLAPDPFPNPLTELLRNPGYIAFAAGRFASTGVLADHPRGVPHNRSELYARLATVRAEGVAIDRGDLHPSIGCIAVPWRGAGEVAALACLGTPAEIIASAGLARTVLEAAAAPAATREHVVAAAAARHYSVASSRP
jgi:DNA-binding IclR family transcriptional regulator